MAIRSLFTETSWTLLRCSVITKTESLHVGVPAARQLSSQPVTRAEAYNKCQPKTSAPQNEAKFKPSLQQRFPTSGKQQTTARAITPQQSTPSALNNVPTNNAATSNSKEYLAMPIEIRNNIQVVDSAHGLEKFQQKLHKEVNETSECNVLLGWDSEWRPTRSKGDLAQTAVLQLALSNAVFLLDIPALRAEMGFAVASERVFSTLNNERLRKLVVGGVNNEVFPLKQAFSIKNKIKLANVLCLSQLHSALVSQDLAFIVHAEKSVNIIDPKQGTICGLLTLCRYYLGKTLLKQRSIQMSNWEFRPLTERQKEYAAMDAYVPILIYKAMQKRAAELRIDFDSVAEIVSHLEN